MLARVHVWTVLENRLWDLKVDADIKLYNLFQKIVSTIPNLDHLKKHGRSDVVFQKLTTPVRVDPSVLNKDIITMCLKEENLTDIQETTLINQLTSNWDGKVVYFVINRADKQEIAIRKLTTSYPDLFKCLQVKVGTLLSWRESDVVLNGGILRKTGPEPPILKRLRAKRTFHENEKEPRQAAAKQHVGFDLMFKGVPLEDPAMVCDYREFMALDTVVECYTKYSPIYAAGNNGSSSVKASSFQVPFMHIPFYVCYPDSSYSYSEEISWKFPIFLSAVKGQFRKYTPSSDFSIVSPEYLCPFLIGDVVSNKQKYDRFRMLVQGIAGVRAGQYLMNSQEHKFYVFAVYIDKHLVVHRFIFYESEDCMADSDLKMVEILEEKFDLKREDHAAEFLRETFNLVEIVKELAGNLNKAIKNYLKEISDQASDILSLHSTKGPGPSSPIYEDPQDSDPFSSEEVNSLLESRGYRIELEVPGHPHIVMVSQYDEPGVAAYFKFSRHRDDEADILKCLSKFKSPMNHTIGLIEVLSVSNGSIIILDVGGDPITALENPSQYLWPTLQQLFEGVQFMHDHGVAHLDLKPQNIVIPVEYGRLAIIDYSLAVRVDDGSQDEFMDLVGTEGYIAPEVGKGPYDPIRADLWSCGKVVEEFCLLCAPSPDRERLLQISRLLMNNDPMKRPTMKEILEMVSPSDVKGSSAVGETMSYTDVENLPNTE